MKTKLLKRFLGSAAILALGLNAAAYAKANEATNSGSFTGLNFGLGYGFDIAAMTGNGEAESIINLKKEWLFGKEAKWKGADGNPFVNLKKDKSGKLVPESYDNPATKNYEQEVSQQKDKDGHLIAESGYIEGDYHGLPLGVKELGDEGKNRNMSHYGWISCGYGFDMGGFIVEPVLTLKLKMTPDQRKMDTGSTIYSTYLGSNIGTGFVEVTADTAKWGTNDDGVVAREEGGVMIKVGEATLAASSDVVDDNQKSKDNKDKFLKLLTDNVDATVHTILGKKVKLADLQGDTENNIRALLGLGKDASGTQINRTVYAERTITAELKNNFEAALHANVGYAFNEYFMAYAKLGLSLDVYKLNVKREAISFKMDEATYSPMSFKFDPATIHENLYVRPTDAASMATAASKFDAETKSALYLYVKPEDRAGVKEYKDKALVITEDKLKELKATEGLTAEGTDVKVEKEKNTFTQINADFGVGVAANVYKGLQLRAEFVYSLPMNSEKKMYGDNVELKFMPHKFKFNFGVVVPLSMITG